MTETVQKDHFAEHLGINIISVTLGRAKVEMEIKQRHLNALNLVHGGAIFGLADYAFAAAANSHGTAALGINVSISYMKAAQSVGKLYAEAIEVSRNPRLGTYIIHVTNDEDEKIAFLTGTVYRKKDKIKLFFPDEETVENGNVIKD